MSNCTEKLTVHVTPDQASALTQVAIATRQDKQDILRTLIDQFLAAKDHEYTVIARLRKGEDMARTS